MRKMVWMGKNGEKQSDVHIDFAVNLCDVIAINYIASKQNNRKSMWNIGAAFQLHIELHSVASHAKSDKFT